MTAPSPNVAGELERGSWREPGGGARGPSAQRSNGATESGAIESGAIESGAIESGATESGAIESGVGFAGARFDRSAAEAFLDGALARAAEERAIAIVRFPAPIAAHHAPLRAVRKGHAIGWSPPDGPTVAALGASVRLDPSGDDRFGVLGRDAGELFGATLRVTHPDATPRAPRLYGGWSFAPGAAGAPPWDGFGDGAFVLPRWSYERDGDAATLTAAIDLRDGWARRATLARAELQTVWDALSDPRPEPARPSVARVEHFDREAWGARVRAITDAIARGEAQKIVAARGAVVRTDRDLDPWTVLGALEAAYPKTWCMGMRFGAGTFVAATPERLFVKRGRAVETDALAGSVAAGDPAAAATLRASAKDRREHTPVVAHLLERLGPLTTHLEPAAEPTIRALPNVLHLHTPLRGTLRADVDATDLVRALHPTPAVGGVPSDVATRWIAEHEAPRGWYTGPVGWIDADGDAEVCVALRCGVVRGASAWLWAGGGIVDGSEPDAEWREAALKLRPLLDALGAEDIDARELDTEEMRGEAIR